MDITIDNFKLLKRLQQKAWSASANESSLIIKADNEGITVRSSDESEVLNVQRNSNQWRAHLDNMSIALESLNQSNERKQLYLNHIRLFLEYVEELFYANKSTGIESNYMLIASAKPQGHIFLDELWRAGHFPRDLVIHPDGHGRISYSSGSYLLGLHEKLPPSPPSYIVFLVIDASKIEEYRLYAMRTEDFKQQYCG